MKCPFCKEHAISVALFQPNDEDMLEIGMCEYCAKRFSLFDGACPSVESLMAGMDKESGGGAASASGSAEASGAVQAIQLNVPGQLADKMKVFQKTGRFSGPEDYAALQEQLTMLFQKIQGDSSHQGKVPGEHKAEHARTTERDSLQKELDALVAEERYEDAAQVRDRLKNLEIEGESEGETGTDTQEPDDASGTSPSPEA